MSCRTRQQAEMLEGPRIHRGPNGRAMSASGSSRLSSSLWLSVWLVWASAPMRWRRRRPRRLVLKGRLAKLELTGPQGQQGVPGAKGATGAAGAKGRPGPPGPSPPLRSSRAPLSDRLRTPRSAPSSWPRRRVPPGKILLSGGAQVSAPGVQADRNVELRSSFPFSTTQWQTVLIVTGSLGAGVVMTMKPYVVCGEATPTASSTTPTT